MHPELKAYLDEFEAKAQARHDASARLFDALLSKLITGASTLQLARSAVAASDGGLTVEATVVPVVPDTSSSTTKAQETFELIPGAPPASIEMVPVTCSTECLTQVLAVPHVDEVHDADINDKEVEQLIPAWSPPTISTSTSSLNKEVVPPVAITIDIDPKADVQELDTSPLPSFNLAHPDHPEPQRHPSLIAQAEYGTRLVSKGTTRCLPPVRQGIVQQPWPPPLLPWIRYMGHLFRPRSWPSLKYDSVAGYPEEPSSGTPHQPHEVSGFSVELVPLPFSDASSPQVPCRESNSMEESFCCLLLAKLQSGRPPDHAIAGNIIQMPHVRVRISHMGHLFRPRQWPSFKYHSHAGCPDELYSGIHNQPHDVSGFSAGLVLFLFGDEDFIPVCCCELIPLEEPFLCLFQCETSYGFYWEMLALAVEIFREHLFLLQPKPPWSATALTKIDAYDISTSHFGVHLVGTCFIMIELELCTDLISYRIHPGLHPLCTSTSRALMVLMFNWSLSSERELIAGAMAISTEKLLQSLSFQCDQTCYWEFGSTQACLKLNEVCATAVYLFEGYLSIWSELHIVVHEQVRQWAWCFYLEKSWSIRYLACKSQERGKISEHHILEYVVGGILIPDTLQETTQIMTLSVQWKILRKKQFKYTVSLVHQTCLTVKRTVSLQPWNSSTTVPCFTCFGSRSRQKSLFSFPAYQNGNSPQMPCLDSVYTLGIEYSYFPVHNLRGISQHVSEPDDRSGVSICNDIYHTTSNDSPIREFPVLNNPKVADKTWVESRDHSEDKKQAQDASAMEMAAVLHADSVEEDQLAEDTDSEQVRAVQNTEKNHAKEQPEASSPISCEAGRSGWDLGFLKLLAVHTIQIVVQSYDSKSGSFTSGVLLFGQTKSMTFDYTSCCLSYGLASDYTIAVIMDLGKCNMGTSKLGGVWDPGGQLLVVPSPISVNLHAASPEGSMACTRSKRLPPKVTAIGMEQDENDIGLHLDLVQVHLDNGCYRDKYHGESDMLKDLQAPWDPGELCMTAAWGQAESQGVGDVSDPITNQQTHHRLAHGPGLC